MNDLQIGKIRAEIQSNEQLLAKFSSIDKTPAPARNGKISREEKKKLLKGLPLYPPIDFVNKRGLNNNQTFYQMKPCPPKPQARSMPVLDLGETPTIKWEYPGRESVIALNIPMEDIVDNNLVIDVKQNDSFVI